MNPEHGPAFTEKEQQFLSAYAGISEQQRALAPELLGFLHERQLFTALRALTPDDAPWDLPRLVAAEEALARIDGSLAWTVTLCSGAAWFSGFVNDAVRKQFFSGPDICIAGSGAATGTAVTDGNGYFVNGYWKYATGAPYATAFTCNCIVDGTEQAAFLFLADEVTIHETWNAMGMIATASHAFSVNGLRVPANRCFRIAPEHAVLPQPLFRYPFLQLADTTLAANLSGLALHFLDICDAHFTATAFREKNGPAHTEDILFTWKECERRLQEFRTRFYEMLRRSWTLCEQGAHLPEEQLEGVSESSLSLARYARVLVNELFPYGGLSFADLSHPANRVWRDIHTAGQHALLMR